MGIFDKKAKKDDFDAPVEEVNLAAPPKPPVQPARAAAAAPPQDDDLIRYGIDKAIELMRLLPGDNVELVVRVVKTTLESTNVKISSIIKDAQRKNGEIEKRISVLKKEIQDLEAEIGTRKNEIGILEADHAETTTVKDRLVLAEKLSEDEKKSRPGAAAAMPATPAATPSAVPTTPKMASGTPLPLPHK